jgi:hypothetical protein
MLRSRAPFLVLGLTLATVMSLAMAPPAAAQASTTTTSAWIEVSFTVTNTCTHEDVLISGTIHTVDHVTERPDGFHFVHEENAAVGGAITAVGLTSGTVYNPTGQPLVVEATFRPGDNGELTFLNRQLFLTQGSGPNFYLREYLHVRFVDGQAIVTRDRLSIECHG